MSFLCQKLSTAFYHTQCMFTSVFLSAPAHMWEGETPEKQGFRPSAVKAQPGASQILCPKNAKATISSSWLFFRRLQLPPPPLHSNLRPKKVRWKSSSRLEGNFIGATQARDCQVTLARRVALKFQPTTESNFSSSSPWQKHCKDLY